MMKRCAAETHSLKASAEGRKEKRKEEAGA